jgi:hypothetical protein
VWYAADADGEANNAQLLVGILVGDPAVPTGHVTRDEC